MANSWLEHEAVRERVEQLLESGGRPLENRVAVVCSDFSRSKCDGSFYMFSQPVVYQSVFEPTAFHEIDQCLKVAKTLQIGQRVVEAVLEIPIECKHRDNVRVFGFRQASGVKWDLSAFPILTPLSGSRFTDDLSSINPSVKQTYGISTVTLLKFSDAMTPTGKYQEQLIEKTIRGLYDFIMLDPFGWDEERLGAPIRDMSLLDQFRESAKLSSDPVQWLFPCRWASNLPAETAREFRARCAVPHIDFVRFVFPIVCTDADLHNVECDEDGSIKGIEKVPIVLAATRLMNWPARSWRFLLRRRPEALAVVANVNHLADALASALDWYDEGCSRLQARSEDELVRAPLEAALSFAVRSEGILPSLDTYRSDYDIQVQLPFG